VREKGRGRGEKRGISEIESLVGFGLGVCM